MNNRYLKRRRKKESRNNRYRQPQNLARPRSVAHSYNQRRRRAISIMVAIGVR